jgi:hypothetical protein
MGLLSRLRNLFGTANENKIELIPPGEGHFVYIKIPEPIGPIVRGSKYEDPIDAKLRDRGLGEITGGGSQLGDAAPDGSRPIEFCGIDVDITSLEDGLALLREALIELNAPHGTQLHYSHQGTKLADELDVTGWRLGLPRTFEHPGFGV